MADESAPGESSAPVAEPRVVSYHGEPWGEMVPLIELRAHRAVVTTLQAELTKSQALMNMCRKVLDEVIEERDEARARIDELEILLIDVEQDFTLMLQMGARKFDAADLEMFRARLVRMREALRSDKEMQR